MAWKTLAYKLGNERSEDGQLLPPPRLRYWVHGDASKESFIVAGSNAYTDINRLIEQYLHAPSAEVTLLDFGCGCGRVTRYFLNRNPSYHICATDIDSKCINWNKRHLKGTVQWAVNNPKPPLPYQDESFQVIYANSVFTHLDEDYQFLWLAELQRILAPGGIAILTVHGDGIWQTLTGNVELQEAMSKRGFFFSHINIGVRNFAGYPKFYQTAYHSQAYIRSNWSEYLDVIDYQDSAIDNYQSAVVLGKNREATN